MNLRRLLWSFDGRIGRRAYAGGLLLNLAWAAAAVVAVVHLGKDQELPQPDRPVDPLVFIAMPGFVLYMWAMLALSAKRFHDLGNSGWLSLILIIPLFGYFAVIYLLFARGDDYDNAYGPAQRPTAPLP